MSRPRTRLPGFSEALAVLGAGFCLAATPAVASDLSPPPNLVFIMADDLGKGLLPLYSDHADLATPNIDRLAAEGVVFDNAYASPICLPTRTELVTGCYPVNNGIVGHTDAFANVFLDSMYLRSFAQPLKNAGYATALAGKWHGKGEHQSGQVFRAFGFDEWMLVASQVVTSALRHDGRMAFGPEDFPADRLADFVVDFIGRHRDRPFFVYYPMALVHGPLVATPDKPDAASDAEKLMAMAEYADKMVGRVLDALEANGVRDNTIVFFSGDNGTVQDIGFSFWSRIKFQVKDWFGKNEPDRRQVYRFRGKNLLTEAGVNVPLIVGGGRVARRGRTDALTDFTDMLPTLAALAGVPVPNQYAADGHSIADFILGRADDTRRRWIAAAAAVEPAPNSHYLSMLSTCGITCNVEPVVGGEQERWYWRADDVGVVVRDKRFKLWHHGNGLRALFDLQADPFESVNLWESADPEAAAARYRLLEARRALPEGDVYVQARRLTPNYGLHAHWRLDRPLTAGGGRSVFVDWLGGYRAETDAALEMAPGKFGGAARAVSLRVARFGAFFARHRSNLEGMTLSAWMRLDDQDAAEVSLLRVRRTPDEGRHSPLWLVGKTDASLAAKRWGQGMPTPPGSLPRSRWAHASLTWGPAGGGWETVLYIDGEAMARSRELIAEPPEPGAIPVTGLLEIGGPGVTVDDVAVWRQALTPAQVAAVHVLGDDYGYGAADVDRLFNAPRNHAVQVGGRHWRRLEGTVDSDGLTVVETPEGVRDIRFGDGLVVRSEPPAVPGIDGEEREAPVESAAE